MRNISAEKWNSYRSTGRRSLWTVQAVINGKSNEGEGAGLCLSLRPQERCQSVSRLLSEGSELHVS